MKKQNNFLLLITCCIFSLTTLAQNQHPSKLLNQLKTASGNKKIQLYTDISSFYLEPPSTNLNKALKFAEEGLKKSKKSTPGLLKAKLYHNAGRATSKLSNHRKARRYLNNELEILSTLPQSEPLIYCYLAIAENYQKWGRNNQAIKNYQLAYEKAFDNGLKKLSKTISFSLYIEYLEKKDYENALKYFQIYSSFDKEKHNTELKHVENVYEKVHVIKTPEQQKLEKALKEKDSALIIARESKETLAEKKERLKILAEEKVQKEQELEQKEQKVSKQRNTITFFVALIVIISISTFLLYRQYQQKKTMTDELQNKNLHVQDSINYASRIQQAILKDESEIKIFLPESFIFYQPRDVVSGDFYWFSSKGQKFIIAAADCTGHGVPGAFMSMIGNTLLNEIVNVKNILDPGSILKELHEGINAALKKNHPESENEDGMDIALCTVYTNEKKVKFAGAKNPLYLISNNELKILKGDPFSIGSQPLRKGMEIKFNTKTLNFNSPANFYMFSDGFIDQYGDQEQVKFNTPRFKKMLVSNSNKPMSKQRIIMSNTFQDWKGTQSQIDDVLIVGFRL